MLRAAMDEVYARIPAHSMVTFHDMQTVSANTGLMGRAANIAEGVGAKIAAAVGLTEGRLSSRAVDPLPQRIRARSVSAFTNGLRAWQTKPTQRSKRSRRNRARRMMPCGTSWHTKQDPSWAASLRDRCLVLMGMGALCWQRGGVEALLPPTGGISGCAMQVPCAWPVPQHCGKRGADGAAPRAPGFHARTQGPAEVHPCHVQEPPWA